MSHFKQRPLLFILFFMFSFSVISSEVRVDGEKKLPVFDAHIHYSHDVWDSITPKDAIRRLKAVGVKRALVSVRVMKERNGYIKLIRTLLSRCYALIVNVVRLKPGCTMNRLFLILNHVLRNIVM